MIHIFQIFNFFIFIYPMSYLFIFCSPPDRNAVSKSPAEMPATFLFWLSKDACNVLLRLFDQACGPETSFWEFWLRCALHSIRLTTLSLQGSLQGLSYWPLPFCHSLDCDYFKVWQYIWRAAMLISMQNRPDSLHAVVYCHQERTKQCINHCVQRNIELGGMESDRVWLAFVSTV